MRRQLTARWTLTAILVGALSCAERGPEFRRGVLTASKEQQSSFIRNFNPLLAEGEARWPAQAGIYEPLLIYNALSGDYVPWLATSYAWSPDALELSVELREGVEWSDGERFGSWDVAFTFGLLRRFPALDLKGVWTLIHRIETPSARQVRFHFRRPNIPGLFLIAVQPIVPEHVWKGVPNPVTFANETPVGTGPFTEVRAFNNQVFELGKNPRYWQASKPALEALRLPAYPGNDPANLALVSGELDWAGNFVPAVERTFVARDPEHFKYWFPPVEGTVMLYANTQRPPFGDVHVRKALSMAIDRELAVKVALHGYVRPSDATGLSAAYDRFRDPEAVARGDWVKFDPARAERLLDEAGLMRGAGGFRRRSDGTELAYELYTVAGWTDWMRAAQVVASGLRRVGVGATLRVFELGAWYDKLRNGEFDLSLGWSEQGPTPYTYYRGLMSSDTLKPPGQPTDLNWNRFASKAADTIFREFERTSDAGEQRRLAGELQRLFVESAPCIPLFPSVSWGEANTRRIEGFPDAEHPYAKLSPNVPPENLLVLVELRPR